MKWWPDYTFSPMSVAVMLASGTTQLFDGVTMVEVVEPGHLSVLGLTRRPIALYASGCWVGVKAITPSTVGPDPEPGAPGNTHRASGPQ